MRPPLSDIGLLLGYSQPPSEMLEAARAAERAGFSELWVGEDYFYTGGISAATALLASTRLPVGIGILPAVGRHPAILAMELATLEGMYPERLTVGLGAGVPLWLNNIGLRPRSPMRSVRNTIGALRHLLAGHELNVEHETFSATGVRLSHVPSAPPKLLIGAEGPKTLKMSGEIADGTVLSVLAGADYVRWARGCIAEGGASPDHRVVLYTLCALDDDPARARDMLRGLIGHYVLIDPRNALTEVQGIADEAEELAKLGLEAALKEVPDAWIDRLAVAGTPEVCAARLSELLAAGADAIALYFPDTEPAVPMIERFGREVLASEAAQVLR